MTHTVVLFNSRRRIERLTLEIIPRCQAVLGVHFMTSFAQHVPDDDLHRSEKAASPAIFAGQFSVPCQEELPC
jgi:hypothetical protein